MKICPYCGQQNPEENQFCNKCGADMVNLTNPQLNPEEQAYQEDLSSDSVLEKGVVKFILYLCCVFIPLIGLILGLLVSVTPFHGRKELSKSLIVCACVAAVIWAILSVIGLIALAGQLASFFDGISNFGRFY